MYMIMFFVPEAHLESVKSALFKAGAGKADTYQHCAWQVMGSGQYLPTEKSHPYQGMPGQLEVLREYQVYMVCEDHVLKPALAALLGAHPYETPAYGAWKITTFEEAP